MNEQKKFHRVATSLYRYGTQGIYYAYWKERGKLRRKKLKSRKVRDAKIETGRLKEKYAKIDPAKRNETLLDAATKYLGTLRRQSQSTRTRANGIVKKLGCSPLASKKISEIRRSNLETWLSQTTEELSNTSYNIRPIRSAHFVVAL